MTISTDNWLKDKSTIVVPIDSRGTNSRALLVAGRLATRLGMGVRIFRQIKEGESPDPHLEKLEAFASYLNHVDRSFEIVEGGNPAKAIVNAVGEHDILCMAASASLLPHGGYLGGVAEDIARSLGQPLFLVGRNIIPDPPPGPTRRIIVPVDGSDLAKAALAPAAAAADRLGVPMWIVTVLNPTVESSDGGDTNLIRGYAKEVHKSFGIEAQFEVLHGVNPAGAITQFAGDDGNVVMTTHGRTGFGRMVTGSVTTNVITHSKRSVIVYRPEEE